MGALSLEKPQALARVQLQELGTRAVPRGPGLADQSVWPSPGATQVCPGCLCVTVPCNATVIDHVAFLPPEMAVPHPQSSL